MVTIGGLTSQCLLGDTLNYKFWAGVDPETPLMNGSEQGWESGANNQFILPADFAEETQL